MRNAVRVGKHRRTPGPGEESRDGTIWQGFLGRHADVAPRIVTTLGVLIVVAGRLAFSITREMFSLGADEMATAGMSRFLAGDRWTMLSSNVYRPGLSVLLLPLTLWVPDPEQWFRLALVVSAVIGGASVCWLHPILQRLTGIEHARAVALASALLLTPPALVSSAHLWAEPLVTLCFLGTVLAVMRLVERGQVRYAISAAGWSLAGVTSHGRLLPLAVLVVIAVLAASVLHRRLLSGGVIACAACVAAATSVMFHSWLVRHLWDTPLDTNTVSGTLGRADSVFSVLDAAVGQLWYQMVAYGLLGVFGAIVLARVVAGRAGGGATVRGDAMVILGLTGPLLLVSVVFMSGRLRGDHIIYGRYNDAIVLPLVGVGWVWLSRFVVRAKPLVVARVVTVAACGLVAIAALVLQLHHTQFELGEPRPMIAGIAYVFGAGGVISVPRATILGLVLFACLIGVAAVRIRPIAIAGVTLGLLTVGMLTRLTLQPEADRWADVGSVPPFPALNVAAEETVWVREGYPEVIVALVSQFRYPALRVAPFADLPADPGPGAVLVLSALDDPSLRHLGGDLIWVSMRESVALWSIADGRATAAFADAVSGL